MKIEKWTIIGVTAFSIAVMLLWGILFLILFIGIGKIKFVFTGIVFIVMAIHVWWVADRAIKDGAFD